MHRRSSSSDSGGAGGGGTLVLKETALALDGRGGSHGGGRGASFGAAAQQSKMAEELKRVNSDLARALSGLQEVPF
jgi:hypothetical protein